MATEGPHVLKRSMNAGADLSSSQYLFVKDDGSGNAVVVAAATDDPVGVLQNNPKQNQQAEIVVIGVTKVVAVGAINPGAYLGSDSAGKAQAVTAQGYGGSYVQATKKAVGKLNRTAAAAANDKTTATVHCVTPIPGT